MGRLPIKLGLVEYYNTEPILHGLSMAPEGVFSIERAIPADCARGYQSGIFDLALIPVAAFFEQEETKMIGDYGICCQGAVRTVVLFSNEPIDQLSHIYLDNHSRTSVQLLKILMKNHYRKDVSYEGAEVADINLATGTGVLMIGDKVFYNEGRFKHCYDLGTAWYDYKKLPFVFAVWAGHKDLPISISQTLNEYISKGLNQIPEMITTWNQKYNLDLGSYLQENIGYHLGASERESINQFKEEIEKL